MDWLILLGIICSAVLLMVFTTTTITKWLEDK